MDNERPLIPAVREGDAPVALLALMRRLWDQNADTRPEFNAVVEILKQIRTDQYRASREDARDVDKNGDRIATKKSDDVRVAAESHVLSISHQQGTHTTLKGDGVKDGGSYEPDQGERTLPKNGRSDGPREIELPHISGI